MIEVKVTSKLLEELNLATEKVLSQYKLSGSELQSSIEFTYKNDVFVLLANDYFQNVAYGRRPRARKVPVEDLIIWMKKKGISPKPGQTYNSVAFAISESVYKTGIKARNFINPVIEVTTDIISEDLANTLSEDIATEIANDLTFTI